MVSKLVRMFIGKQFGKDIFSSSSVHIGFEFLDLIDWIRNQWLVGQTGVSEG